jgi:hypothetical protein
MRATVIQGSFPAGVRIAVQMKPAATRPSPNGTAIPVPPQLATFPAFGGTPLPDAVRQKMESFFRTSFSDVRVHIGSHASSIGAVAFTQGSHIHFAAGQYDPSSTRGQQVLGHELAHVVQQRTGRVQNPFGNGVAIVQDRMLESEADRLGHAAATHALPVQRKLAAPAVSRVPVPRPPIQRAVQHPAQPRLQRPVLRNVARPPVQRKAAGVVQCCFYCGKLPCQHGEVCGGDTTFGGMFSKGSETMRVKYYNQSGGHGGKKEEWEHVVPGAAYRQSGMGGQYKSAPVIAIATEVHRGGVSGVGGGISSTGSSASAQVWAQGLGSTIANGDFAGALRMTLADEMNSAAAHGKLSEEYVNALFRIINGHATQGHITQTEAGTLQNFVYDSYLTRQARPDLYASK